MVGVAAVSVEEAREGVVRSFWDAVKQCGIDPNYQFADFQADIAEEGQSAALDRLILEVQAEGNCRYWVWHQTCPQRYDDETRFCLSCTARTKLAKVTA